MDEKEAIHSLNIIKKVLEKHKIIFWLDYGTLLGAYRDKKLIKWDSDIDLATWITNKNSVEKTFKELSNDFDIFQNKYMIGFRRKNIMISLDFYDKKGHMAVRKSRFSNNFIDKIVSYLIWINSAWDCKIENTQVSRITKFACEITIKLKKDRKKVIIKILKKIHVFFSNGFIIGVPIDYFYNLKQIRFYKMDFNVPVNTDEYLMYRYGCNWKTPKKDYVYYIEDGAIQN